MMARRASDEGQTLDCADGRKSGLALKLLLWFRWAAAHYPAAAWIAKAECALSVSPPLHDLE